MKKVCIIFLLSIIISLTAVGLFGSAPTKIHLNSGENGYLRIHIRADSNAADAQAVKYLVRDELVEYLTPLVAEFSTQELAIEGVRAHLSDIERVATAVLSARGYDYGATADLRVESFPTRVYGEYTLPAGEYNALIVSLGRGAGDNWWCVVYPPLCFAAPTGKNIVYKSKIAEIIEKFVK